MVTLPYIATLLKKANKLNLDLDLEKILATKPKLVAQSRPALYFLQQLQPAPKYLLQDKLIMQGEKCKYQTQNLQRNNVVQQVEGYVSRTSPPLRVLISKINICLIYNFAAFFGARFGVWHAHHYATVPPTISHRTNV